MMETRNPVTAEILANGGGTYAVQLGVNGLRIDRMEFKTGYMASHAEFESIISVEELSDFNIGWFIGDHFSELTEPGNYLGAWVTNGRVYLDVSRHFEGVDSASAFGFANGQLAIFDIAQGAEIIL